MELDRARSTIKDRIEKWADEIAEEEPNQEALEYPEFPDDDVPVEDILALQKKRIERRIESYKAHTWYTVRIKEPGPIGILWFGDPHIDDNGCHLPLLMEHIELCQEYGLYGANIGDTTNNWASRLVHLYANQDTSLKTARKLAKWLMLESGVNWLVWLMGNHDLWGDGSEILKLTGAHKIVMHDWEARFSLEWPDSNRINIYAAHDFPGHSQWNPGHGPMKMAQMGEDADLYICGHKHEWYSAQWENARRGGTVPNVVRVRGYKFLDEYARDRGLPEQKSGASCLTILRPYATDPTERVHRTFDIEFGARILEMERKHFERTNNT